MRTTLKRRLWEALEAIHRQHGDGKIYDVCFTHDTSEKNGEGFVYAKVADRGHRTIIQRTHMPFTFQTVAGKQYVSYLDKLVVMEGKS
jgi:hypothetical protein